MIAQVFIHKEDILLAGFLAGFIPAVVITFIHIIFSLIKKEPISKVHLQTFLISFVLFLILITIFIFSL